MAEYLGGTNAHDFEINKKVYPNPCIDHLSVEVEIPGMKDDETGESRAIWIEIGIYDMGGKRVKSAISQPIAPGRYSLTFDTRDLANGRYMALVESVGFEGGWDRITTDKGALFVVSK